MHYRGFTTFEEQDMYILLISIVVGLFLAMLFLNFYFRWKVLKLYHYLTRNQIEFEASHVFSLEKLREEVLPRYPDSREQIETFVKYVRFSVKMASILIILTIAFGSILMYYSHHAN